MALLDGLVAYWKLEEASGSRNDEHGANDLTDVNTVTQVTGKLGNAAQFTGANGEALTVADNASLGFTTAFSASFWFRRPNFTAQACHLSKWIWSTDGNFFIQSAAGGGFLLIIIATSAADAGTGCNGGWAVSFSASTWHHVAIVFDGSLSGNDNRLKAWVDGVLKTPFLVNSGAVPATLQNDGADLVMGRAGDSRGTMFDYLTGDMDEVALWNRPLTSGEVAALYKAGAGLAYPLLEPEGDLAVLEAADAAAISGGVLVEGDLAASDAPDLAAFFEPSAAGALAVTEAPDVFAGEGLAPWGHTFEMELAGVGLGWTDVTEDVLLDAPPVAIQYGIAGTGPLDLVASTGTMKLSLKNGESNSAGTLGYYSPRHASCRPGFELGIRVRYSYIAGPSPYGKFIGRLREIEPEPGRYRDRKTHCLVVDWMDAAAITGYNAPTQVGKRADEVLATIVALVPRQPDSTSYDVADSTFPYALDNGLTEGAKVLTEIQRICQSEFGRCYVRGGLGYWGQLRFEKRTARLTPSPVATFNGTMQKLDAGSGTGKVKNKARVTAHPRRVDATNTVVLFSKPNQSNPAVAAAQTIKLSGKYVDPSNPNARVGGTDMITPAATTDYLMNATADGGGADLTANFTVTAVLGANQVVYTITNNGGTTGYVTKLQARGRGLYDYDPLEAEVLDQTSIDLIGESAVTLDMPYQSAYTVTQAIAQFLVDTWSVAGGASEGSIKFIPRTEAELLAAMALEPGIAIAAMEDLAVVNDVYFIQNVGLKITGDQVAFDFDLQRALVQDYWTLGVAGYSELGINTVWAPL